MLINRNKTTEYTTKQNSETRPVYVSFKRLKRETGSTVAILIGRNEEEEKIVWNEKQINNIL